MKVLKDHFHKLAARVEFKSARSQKKIDVECELKRKKLAYIMLTSCTYSGEITRFNSEALQFRTVGHQAGFGFNYGWCLLQRDNIPLLSLDLVKTVRFLARRL